MFFHDKVNGVGESLSLSLSLCRCLRLPRMPLHELLLQQAVGGWNGIQGSVKVRATPQVSLHVCGEVEALHLVSPQLFVNDRSAEVLQTRNLFQTTNGVAKEKVHLSAFDVA